MQNVSREKVEETNPARLRVVSLVAQLDYSFHHPDNKEILYSNVQCLRVGWSHASHVFILFLCFLSFLSLVDQISFKRFLQICEETAPYMYL